MLTASVLLLVIGVLGAFDVVVFHERVAQIVQRPECRREAWIHVARGPVYAVQFVVLPNVRMQGAWLWALWALFALDALIALLDVSCEPESRRCQGGLPAGEYLMHVVLSVLVGAMLHASLAEAWTWRSLPTALVWAPRGPVALGAVLAAMAAVVTALTMRDVVMLLLADRPRPVHVSVRIPASVARVWDVTQDHHLHPEWDHRFDRIEMLSDRIETGTRMRYEKTVLGMKIRGWGRYKLHRQCTQSTFEFGSDDRRSIISRGVGLWRYRALPGGGTEFMTSYTYEVRWGVLGRLIDICVFRPLFQWETERSFRRLAREHFGVSSPRVLGADRRKPARFHEAWA